ncbi:TPA_asm: hypothetical protein GF958_14700 [Listeria monocytogenes]|nr:hypothetical protein [Listeria monocytogenes]
MTLYHVETQEDYDALMVELEEEGCVWASGTKPTHDNNWIDLKKDTVIERSIQNRLTYAHKYYFENSCTDTPIEKYKVKQDEVAKWFGGATNAMKAFSSGGVSMKNDNNDNVNNPAHYRAGGIETLYEHKNGIEDLKKAQFYLDDLIEWMESD